MTYGFVTLSNKMGFPLRCRRWSRATASWGVTPRRAQHPGTPRPNGTKVETPSKVVEVADLKWPEHPQLRTRRQLVRPWPTAPKPCGIIGAVR